MSALPSVSPSGREAPAAPVLGVDAAHGLFERHAGKIYAFCLSRLGCREEAEDAVQSTFLNAFRALRRGVVPHSETAWLYKIAENVCRQRQRRGRRRPEIVQDPATLERSAPSTATARDELLGLDDALQRLAPRQRRALLLREWHGLSYKEIAAELQLSPAAVETLLFRARRSLAQNLDSPQRLRSRLRVPGLHVGSLVAWLKSLLGGSAAVKVAAAGVVVASTALAGSGPPGERDAPPPVDRSTPKRAVAATSASPRPRAVLQRAPSAATEKRGAHPRQAATGRPARRRTPEPPPTTGGGAPTTPPPAATRANTPTPAPHGGTPGTPAAPATPSLPSSPSLPTPPAPTPPVSLPPVEVPSLPQLPLPQLPKLTEPPPLPPAPQLPAVPELPELPKLGQ